MLEGIFDPDVKDPNKLMYEMMTTFKCDSAKITIIVSARSEDDFLTIYNKARRKCKKVLQKWYTNKTSSFPEPCLFTEAIARKHYPKVDHKSHYPNRTESTAYPDRTESTAYPEYGMKVKGFLNGEYGKAIVQNDEQKKE